MGALSKPDTGLGYGQTWQNVISYRALGVTYYNTTGKPILVFASGAGPGNGNLNAFVDGVNAATAYAVSSGNLGATFVVPVGSAYSVTLAGAVLGFWCELR